MHGAALPEYHIMLSREVLEAQITETTRGLRALSILQLSPWALNRESYQTEYTRLIVRRNEFEYQLKGLPNDSI